MEDNKLQSLIIGALLHDIGKLLQRSGGIFFNETDFINKKMSHSAYGYGFVKKLLVDDKWDIAKCVLYHHAKKIKENLTQLKDNDIAYIVYEADNIAAGSDRRENDEIDQETANFERETPLESIFNILQTEVSKTQNSKAYHLKTLEEDKPFNYPIDKTKCKATKSCYQEIEKILNKHLKDDKINDIKGMPVNKDTINSLLQLLEATSSYITSDTYGGNLNDISLYDHCKLTAAIASCMYLYFKENKIEDYINCCFKDSKRDEDYFLLVSGDLSGVQDFIYTIASKGALKSLRARSFYLDLMLEHIVDEILEKLQLSRANLIYTGGGHFYMFLPNTNESKDLLKDAEIKINQWFLNKYGVALYLALESEPCCPYDFMTIENDKRNESKKRSTKDVFRAVSENLSQKKLQRYNNDQLKDLFDKDSKLNSIPKENIHRECPICHTSQVDLDKRFLNGEEIFDNCCLNCWNLYLMGKELVFRSGESDIKVMPVRYSLPETKDKAFIELPSLDDKVRIMTLENAKWVENDLKKHPKDKYIRIYTKNKWMTGLGISTNLWMGDYNKEPKDKDGLIEFKELSEMSTGIKRLAVMRADVDNLGYTFVTGFDKKDTVTGKWDYRYCTLSRYTTLSRQLSLFFKHYINRVCKSNITGIDCETIANKNFAIGKKERNDEKKKDKNLVIVYSGGDDVFVVGSWDDVIDFTVDLRRAFTMFTNDKLTFSAGIGFFSDSFPIYQMAHLTGKLEDKAKDYPNSDNPTKNALALFGIDKTIDKDGKVKEIKHVYSWNDFEKGVYPKVEYFIDNFSPEGSKDEKEKLEISTAFLYKLLVLLEKDLNDGKYSINLARLAYAMARQEARIKESNVKQKQKLKDLKEKVYQWAQNEKDRKELLTTINILVYLFRDKTKHKMEVS